jgi:cytochrome c biogenesis protein CcdA
MYETIPPLTAFGAGILSVLSPCILPLLPAVLATSAGKSKIRPLAIVLGVSISFILMGVVTSIFGAAFRSHIGQLKIMAETLILLMGFSLLLELNIFNIFLKFPLFVDMNEEGAISGLLLGLSLGVLWIPCIGPILGSILAMVALEGSTSNGAFTLSIYSLGFSMPMLVLAYSAHFSSSKLRLISRYDEILKKGAGMVIILFGFWMVYHNHFRGLF